MESNPGLQRVRFDSGEVGVRLGLLGTRPGPVAWAEGDNRVPGGLFVEMVLRPACSSPFVNCKSNVMVMTMERGQAWNQR